MQSVGSATGDNGYKLAMPYDRIIRINIRAPQQRNEYGEPLPSEIISSRLYWVERLDGGTTIDFDRGGLETRQEIIYRLRYDRVLLTTDVTLIDILDETPIISDTGQVSGYRHATPYNIHESDYGRRREIEIMATLQL